MKSRKLMSFALALVMMLALFAGCSGSTGGGQTASTAPAPAASDAAPAGNAPAAAEPLKIAVLLNGTLGDKSFFDSANDGAMRIQNELGCTVKVIEMGYDETRWEPSLADICDEDWDIVITGTWQMVEFVEKQAQATPDKKFIIFDTGISELPNVYGIEYKQNEGSYLAGVLGASMSKTGAIGFVGGMEIPVITDFLVGYIQGAQETKSDIKVASSFIGDFFDAPKGKELALAQFNQNVDLIFSCASTAGLGTLDGCAEKGKYAIGVDADQAMLFKDSDPAKADLILSSMMKRVDNSLFRAVQMHLEGTLPWSKTEQLGIAENCVGLAKTEFYEKNVPADVRAKIDAAEADILSGKIKVQTSLGMDEATLTNIKNSVKP